MARRPASWASSEAAAALWVSASAEPACPPPPPLVPWPSADDPCVDPFDEEACLGSCPPTPFEEDDPFGFGVFDHDGLPCMPTSVDRASASDAQCPVRFDLCGPSVCAFSGDAVGGALPQPLVVALDLDDGVVAAS